MKLHLYFARRFAMTFLGVFVVFFGILTLLDIVEQMRKFSDAEIGFGAAAELSILSVPESLYRILPLVVILATLALFLGLARSSELVVTRAAGRSALRALIAPVVTALLIGIVGVTVMNPIVAATQQQYEIKSEQYRTTTTSVLSISEEGLWFRQGRATGQSVIRADRANPEGTIFYNATFVDFDIDGYGLRRIEAKSAELGAGVWVLKDAKVWSLRNSSNPELGAERHDLIELGTDLTREQIKDSFAQPSAIPIWELPSFIADLNRAGFSARLHKVWLHTELALPALLASMVLIGAGFTLRHTRFGRTGQMVLMALLMGLAVFFLRNFAQILGEDGQIPVILAAWSPPIAAILLSLGLLLHLEDG